MTLRRRFLIAYILLFVIIDGIAWTWAYRAGTAPTREQLRQSTGFRAPLTVQPNQDSAADSLKAAAVNPAWLSHNFGPASLPGETLCSAHLGQSHLDQAPGPDHTLRARRDVAALGNSFGREEK